MAEKKFQGHWNLTPYEVMEKRDNSVYVIQLLDEYGIRKKVSRTEICNTSEKSFRRIVDAEDIVKSNEGCRCLTLYPQVMDQTASQKLADPSHK